MPKVRGSAEKWQRRAQQAAADYQSGVQSPRVEWHTAVAAAVPAYEAGIADALQERRYQRAATPQAGEKLKRKASTLGVQRYTTGVQASKDAYQQGFAPYAQVIEGTTLPDRGRRGDPANLERARIMAQALHQAKRERSRG